MHSIHPNITALLAPHRQWLAVDVGVFDDRRAVAVELGQELAVEAVDVEADCAADGPLHLRPEGVVVEL
ncbi:MAG: hypothetical protein AAF460_12155 [Pseudomonadota bacterium]